MKNIIVVVSTLLIGFLEATGDLSVEGTISTPSSPAIRQRSRTSSASFTQSKPIMIRNKLSFYEELINEFTEETVNTEKKLNKEKSRFFSILKNACFNDHLESMQNFINLSACRVSIEMKTTLGNWIDEFQKERGEQLANYTAVITELHDGYDPSLAIDTESAFHKLLTSTQDTLDLADIKSITETLFPSKKDMLDSEENSVSLTDPCGALFSRCLESYKFSSPTRSRTSSVSAALL